MKPHNKWVEKIRRSGVCSNCPQTLREGYGAWWDGVESLMCTKCKPRPDREQHRPPPAHAPKPPRTPDDAAFVAVAWLRAGELAHLLGRDAAAAAYLERAMSLLDPTPMPPVKVLSYGPADE